jgi:NAD(P)H-dependent flavin oxidoreductase YrpB (nitropropane dioxygenase family)
MRFLRNERAEDIVKRTLEDIPEFFLGKPLDSNEKILELERTGFDDLIDGKAETALMFGGEVVGRIDDLPTTEELIRKIVSDAAKVLHETPQKIVNLSKNKS